jgi:two-component system chemotaxis response regulator CheB
MPKHKRILVVDDSVVIRLLMKEVFQATSWLEVETAGNGKVALEKVALRAPDLILLDVEMPTMDGLATLAQLRKDHADLPVIMFSSSTDSGSKMTVEALSLGASDYFPKPSTMGGGNGGGDAVNYLRKGLVPKVVSLLERSSAPRPRAQPKVDAPPATRACKPSPLARFDIVTIASSTGGPNALANLLPGFTRALPVPVVIVQHMPPVFTRLLAERLALSTGIPVIEAAQDMRLKPGTVYIAPGDFHLWLSRQPEGVDIVLNREPPENSCRPSADVMMRSAAACYGANALGVVLTGMGQDGLKGCESLRQAGGRVLVQDEKSSVVWGMPGAVTRAGLADEVLPLDAMGAVIKDYLSQGRMPG